MTNMKQTPKIEPRISAINLVNITNPLLLAISKMPDEKAIKILASKKTFGKFVQDFCKKFEIPLIMGNISILAQLPIIIKMYDEVFGVDVNELTEMSFNDAGWDANKFPRINAVSPKINEDQMVEAICKKFSKTNYRYMNPMATKIEGMALRDTGLYLSAHTDQDRADEIHRGKSYNTAKKELLIFSNPKEYIADQALRLFTEKPMLDIVGWARLDAKWPDGSLVVGRAGDDGAGLRLSRGLVTCEDPEDGVRERFLFKKV